MNNKGQDQSVQILRLIRLFDVCIAKGRFSCLEDHPIEDLTQVKIDYAYAKKLKKQINCSIAQIDKPLHFSLLKIV